MQFIMHTGFRPTSWRLKIAYNLDVNFVPVDQTLRSHAALRLRLCHQHAHDLHCVGQHFFWFSRPHPSIRLLNSKPDALVDNALMRDFVRFPFSFPCFYFPRKGADRFHGGYNWRMIDSQPTLLPFLLFFSNKSQGDRAWKKIRRFTIQFAGLVAQPRRHDGVLRDRRRVGNGRWGVEHAS